MQHTYIHVIKVCGVLINLLCLQHSTIECDTYSHLTEYVTTRQRILLIMNANNYAE